MQTNYPNKKAIVWTQTNCQYCVMAKALLSDKGYDIEERMMGEGLKWAKKDLLEAVPHARSVPQIFLDGKYIGGWQQLKDSLYSDDYS